MQKPTHDIIIRGAGPVGAALALMLAAKTGRPERIALMGRLMAPSAAASTPDENTGIDTPDPRTLALNHGSRVLLEQLGVWPRNATDIHTVHVSQKGRLGRTLIDRHDLDVPRLGSVVAYAALLSSLHDSLHNSGINVLEQADSTLALSGELVSCVVPGQQLFAKVAVQSDGQPPQGLKRHYNQDALLATVRASLPCAHMAYERFTRQGPLALLPHPDGAGVYAVVWCCPPGQAQHLKELDQAAFDIALNLHFGERMGTLRSIGERHVFPLSMHAGASLINPRTVAIGNAAQTLHPVAGQGLNLGLRDVAQLARTLTPWLAQPGTDAAPYLKQFTQRRLTDRWLTAGITDFLPRIFTTGNPLVEHGGGLALLGLDLIPPARDTLARHLLQGLRI